MVNDGQSSTQSTLLPDFPFEAFCDSNILINYLNREWEPATGLEIVESDHVLVVINEDVEEEVKDLIDRRWDLYQDLLGYLLDEEGRIGEFTYSEYLPENDYRHLRDLQMGLSSENPEIALVRLREFTSEYKRTAELLFGEYVSEVVFTSPPFLFEMDLKKIIPKNPDAVIVAGVADWTDQGGSGILITNDTSDIVDFRDSINEAIEEHLGKSSTLVIIRPTEVNLPGA